MERPRPLAGILIQTSIAIRIRLLEYDKKKNFIIADLDDHTIFVDETHIEDIRD